MDVIKGKQQASAPSGPKEHHTNNQTALHQLENQISWLKKAVMKIASALGVQMETKEPNQKPEDQINKPIKKSALLILET